MSLLRSSKGHVNSLLQRFHAYGIFIRKPCIKERAKERGISTEIIGQVINSPGQIIEEAEPGQKIYQSIIAFPENKTYLVRVFVSNNKEPGITKSVYRASKIDKYYEGKI